MYQFAIRIVISEELCQVERKAGEILEVYAWGRITLEPII